MQQAVMATLRYGKLSNGIAIPCAYALERSDGKSIIFQNGYEYRSLAYHLGAPVDADGWDTDNIEHDKAVAWLDANEGEAFDISGSYDTLEETAWV